MPIYEFKCKKCGNTFETIVFSSDKSSPECPECKSGKVKKMLSAGSIRPHGIPSGSGGFKPPACAPAGGG